MKSNTSESMRRLTLQAAIAAIAGVAVALVGISIAMVSFNHSNAMPFHCWNHFGCELGFPGASERTWLFNGTLIVSSVLLLPALQVLGKHLNTRLGDVAAGFGYVACLGTFCLGLHALNQDLFGAPYIFRQFLLIHVMFVGMAGGGWLVALTLFTIDFCRRWKEPASRFMAMAGIICWLGFLATGFALIYANPPLAIIRRDWQDPVFRSVFGAPTSRPILSPWLDSYRPRIWWPAVFIMGLVLLVLLWVGVALVFLWLKTKEKPAARRKALPSAAAGSGASNH